MDGCAQGAQAPPNLEALSSVAVWREEEGWKAPSSALPRKSTSPAPPGWLRLPTRRVEVVLPLPTPLSWCCPLLWGCLPGLPQPREVHKGLLHIIGLRRSLCP